jgi:hypothetical protein
MEDKILICVTLTMKELPKYWFWSDLTINSTFYKYYVTKNRFSVLNNISHNALHMSKSNRANDVNIEHVRSTKLTTML